MIVNARHLISVCIALSALSSAAIAQDPATGSNSAAQSATDVIREFAKADGAFLAAGLVRIGTLQKDNLASLLEYPTDHIVVVALSGNQIRQAFERSVSLYPQPNFSFLQISGFEVSFKKTGTPDARVTSISASGVKLEDGRMYNVAMPSSLQRGGLGYFKIWDNAKIVSSFDNKTLEDILKGKPVAPSAARWSPQG